MCSSVCQGLQSCQEVVGSRFLKLKLAPPQTNFTEPGNEETNTAFITTDKNDNNDCELIANRDTDMGGWSFFQSLSDAKAPVESDNVYVHPLVKCSAFRLSEKNLEMCTERLGSETGSEGSDVITLFSLETRTVACDFIPSKPRESSWTRKTSRSNSFPPPLTSISGSNGVQVKSHRENGRLVLQAVSFPPCHSYFQAERSKGRLRISLFKEATPVLDNEEHGEDDEEEEEEEEVEVEEEEEEGNNGNDGGEIGAGKLQRPNSCKQSGRGNKGSLLNWKPFLLAT